MKQKNKKMSGGKKLVLAGAAAVGAGAYYLLGPDGKKHQKKASFLMNTVKKEIQIGIAKGKKLEKEWNSVSKNTTKKSLSTKKK
jgi:hypothetical protein